ncbi:MAG: hypothetical protein KDE04_15235 [Anaerolineales bacterium]|nr:hypothetical protein [Anaerolineales bacterium]
MSEDNPTDALARFIGDDEDPTVRYTFDEATGEVYFAVVDVIAHLTDSNDPAQYLKRMRQRDQELKASWKEMVKRRSMPTRGGQQSINAAKLEDILRIVQSIPSAKAEPLKRWLARTGAKHIYDLQIERYRRDGYSDEWIEKRLRSKSIRSKLTDAWARRGVQEGLEYALLTNEISKTTFGGLTVGQHKKLKNLDKKHNLRDHMTEAELVFQSLAELTTRQIAENEDAQGFEDNQSAARRGGRIAGNARREFERETGSNVVSENNYLEEPEAQARLRAGNEEPDEDVPF